MRERCPICNEEVWHNIWEHIWVEHIDGIDCWCGANVHGPRRLQRHIEECQTNVLTHYVAEQLLLAQRR